LSRLPGRRRIIGEDRPIGNVSRPRQIVALGGGGFSDEPDNPLLDDFVLALTGRSCPRVCFLPTASGDAAGYVQAFYRAFPATRAEATHVALVRRTVVDLRAFVLEQDVVYVGGGNTANMLAIWRVHGLDAVLREAWERGVVLCGISAGGICWFEAGLTDSFGPDLQPLPDGLGILPGSFCPHYDGEVGRRPAYQAAVAAGLPDGYAADDGAALHYVDRDLREIVSSRSDARVYRVSAIGAFVAEVALRPRYLSALKPPGRRTGRSPSRTRSAGRTDARPARGA
jgi:dipeptidase E